VFFGPLIGAFVEPDEKQLVKYPSPVQNSIFAAGPFFNALLAGIVFLVLMLILNPLQGLMIEPNGVTFANVQDGYPAQQYGVLPNVAYTELNGQTIEDGDDFVTKLQCVKPGDEIVLSNANQSLSIITGANPSDENKGYLGVSGIKTNMELKGKSLDFKIIYYILYFFINLLEWVFMLSLGIGLANLMPLGPVDGGRMLHITMKDIMGQEKGDKWLIKITLIVFVILLILIFVPIIKSLFFKI
jgi:membrane-associated protease RseP (regulator of RpoE activity)